MSTAFLIVAAVLLFFGYGYVKWDTERWFGFLDFVLWMSVAIAALVVLLTAGLVGLLRK